MLQKDYPWLNLPDLKEVQTKYLNANLYTNIKYISDVSLYRDSALYYFSDDIDFYGKIPLWCFPAKYLGDINNLQQQIATQLTGVKANSPIDSVCVFELIISVSGELKSIKLIGGAKSDLSNIIKATFLSKENRYFDNSKEVKWKAAIRYNTSRPIETKLRVFIKVKEHSNFTTENNEKLHRELIFTFRLKPLPHRDITNYSSVVSTSQGRSAEFIGDLRSVEKEIAEKIKLSKKNTEIDSIIVFRALVTREEYPLKDSLIVEKLLYGEPSVFSDLVKEALISPKNGKWIAAVSANNGQRMTTRIKIFAQLKKNGTVEIQLPRLLANWTGD